MSDKEMDAVLRAWMPEAPAGQPDRSRVVGNVISRLGSMRRRPRRWWPFSILRSEPTTAKAPESQDGQPRPLEAPDDHTPIITGRTHIMFSPVKASILGAVIAVGGAFLIAQPFQQESTVPGAATVATAAQDAALSTGRRLHQSEIGFESESQASPGLFAQRGRTTNVRSVMGDARLSGDVVIVDNADRFFGGDPADDPSNYLGDVLWGNIEITNDGGAWAGTMVGTTDTTADGGGVTYFELVGSGGYEGLSAVIFEREEPIGAFTWNAFIFPGELPPDR